MQITIAGESAEFQKRKVHKKWSGITWSLCEHKTPYIADDNLIWKREIGFKI
jgi:hypothetical protein